MKLLKLSLVAFFSVLFIWGCSPSEPEKPFQVLANNQASKGPEVIEFFAYFCPHCNHIEENLKPWREKLPKSVTFIRIPLTLGNTGTRIYSKAYFIGQALNVLTISHPALFDRYHKQKLPLSTDSELKQFYLQLGVSETAYDKVVNDPTLEEKINHAENLAKSMGIASVPSFVVNGRFLTDAGMSGGEKPLFKLLNLLLRKKSP